MEKITLPKGTKDIGDPEIFIWYHVENIVRLEAVSYTHLGTFCHEELDRYFFMMTFHGNP